VVFRLHSIAFSMLLVRRIVLMLAGMAALGGVAPAAETAANGIFLIAKRDMRDPRFQQTVVLVTQPARGSPFGVIINRPLDHPLSEVFPEQATLKGKKDLLYFGGPVAREGLVFLVRSAAPPGRAVQVLNDVYFTGDVNSIEALLKRRDATRGLRVYAGYSGWGPGQLQNEIQRGDWHVLPADAETIFDKDPARIWPELIQRVTAHQTREEQGERRKAEGGSGGGGIGFAGHQSPASGARL
jgi:putative transcriptional regulator